MKAEAVLISPKDNVVTVISGAAPGQRIHYYEKAVLWSVTAEEIIPPYHKMAIKEIPAGGHAVKYGEVIGKTTRRIPAGAWVSHLNLESIVRDYDDELEEIICPGGMTE